MVDAVEVAAASCVLGAEAFLADDADVHIFVFEWSVVFYGFGRQDRVVWWFVSVLWGGLWEGLGIG